METKETARKGQVSGKNKKTTLSITMIICDALPPHPNLLQRVYAMHFLPYLTWLPVVGMF